MARDYQKSFPDQKASVLRSAKPDLILFLRRSWQQRAHSTILNSCLFIKQGCWCSIQMKFGLQCFLPGFQTRRIKFPEVSWIEHLEYILVLLSLPWSLWYFQHFLLPWSTWRQFFYTDSSPVQLSFHTENISIVAICMLQNISISYLITSVNWVKDTWISSITSVTVGVPFDAVLCIEHGFTFRNKDCWYYCPVIFDYGTEFDSFLPPDWLHTPAAAIVTLQILILVLSV